MNNSPLYSDDDLTGKVALVTGAARGIGFGAARMLAQQGAYVALLDRDSAALNGMIAELRRSDYQVSPHSADVAEASQVDQVIAKIVAETGAIHIVVNSAAIQPYGTVETTSEADWDRIIAVNLKGVYLTNHFAIPHIRAAGGGAIVNVASVQGLACQTNVAAYVASKGAILALTRAMALDHAKDNIRVNAVCPGSIDTPLLRFAASQIKGAASEEEIIALWGRMHPLGRVGHIDEVAAMIAFLCGSRSSFCTGGEYKVDGGLLAKLGAVLPE